jgi:hypothetical protein
MGYWRWILGGAAVFGGLAALCVATNPQSAAFEQFAIEKVKTELCPDVPVVAKDCPRFIDENQPMLQTWIRKNTQSQNFGLFTQYETNLSVRELIPEPIRPLLAFAPLPQNYRLQTIGVLGRFIIYNAKSTPR